MPCICSNSIRDCCRYQTVEVEEEEDRPTVMLLASVSLIAVSTVLQDTADKQLKKENPVEAALSTQWLGDQTSAGHAGCALASSAFSS